MDNLNEPNGLGTLVDAGATICRSLPNVINLNKWQHALTIIMSAGFITLYVNGVDVTDRANCNNSTVIPNAAAPTQIGARAGASDRNFHGAIDDVRIYNRVLSAGEIQQLYLAGK